MKEGFLLAETLYFMQERMHFQTARRAMEAELGDESGSFPFLANRSILCCKVLEHQKHLSSLHILKILSQYLFVEHLYCLSQALWALGLQVPVETELAHCLTMSKFGSQGHQQQTCTVAPAQSLLENAHIHFQLFDISPKFSSVT